MPGSELWHHPPPRIRVRRRASRNLWGRWPRSTGRSSMIVRIEYGLRTCQTELARRITSAEMGFAIEITAPQSGRVIDGTASDVTVPERKKADGALVSVSMGVAGPVYRMTSAQRNSGVLPVHAPVRQRGKVVVVDAVSVLTSPLTSHPGGFRPTQASIHDDAAESGCIGDTPS